MQKNIYTGTIGKDAVEQKIGNYNYAKFSIAVDDGKDNEGKRKTLWLDVLKIDKESKLTPYLLKGTIVEVDGRISVGAYVNKEDKAVGTMTLWCNELGFLHSPRKENAQEVQQEDNDLPEGF